ncbi:MAG TPA: type III pantothenate kinase [Salinivirgaceae bacterium]|nr:type III pantothenate kinase [Salinivirgaceae bacterium]HQA75775.1 type III pantothenate kinase [Salinivirgaceae bacterium]
MYVVIDIGNTTTKVGYFKNNELIEKKIVETNKIRYDDLFNTHIKAVIIAASGRHLTGIENYLTDKNILFYVLSYKTKLPIKIDYKTPETLGLDRIAGSVGATVLFPNRPSLIIDIGTAVTYDLVVNNCFMGGNISPGLKLRSLSLNEHTEKLPLVDATDNQQLYGKSTIEAIENGVFNGLKYEIEATIKYFSEIYSDISVIITGGDAHFFVNIIKTAIFVEPNLVLIGLNRILLHNV